MAEIGVLRLDFGAEGRSCLRKGKGRRSNNGLSHFPRDKLLRFFLYWAIYSKEPNRISNWAFLVLIGLLIEQSVQCGPVK